MTHPRLRHFLWHIFFILERRSLTFFSRGGVIFLSQKGKWDTFREVKILFVHFCSLPPPPRVPSPPLSIASVSATAQRLKHVPPHCLSSFCPLVWSEQSHSMTVFVNVSSLKYTLALLRMLLLSIVTAFRVSFCSNPLPAQRGFPLQNL